MLSFFVNRFGAFLAAFSVGGSCVFAFTTLTKSHVLRAIEVGTRLESISSKDLKKSNGSSNVPKVIWESGYLSADDFDCVGTKSEKRKLAAKYKGLPEGVGLCGGSYSCDPHSILTRGEENKKRCARREKRAAGYRELYTAKTRPLRILSKPRSKYTCKAKLNDVQGKVFLSIRFLENGKIGKIKVVKGLPYGLTKQAIAAAKRVKFNPPRKDGRKYSVTKKLVYRFTIY